MGQSAPRGFTKALQHLRGSLSPCYRLVSASSWKRLIFLLIVSVVLSMWLATGNVDANMLFQSPQSAPVQPAAAQPSPVQQPAVEQPPVEQPVQQPAAEQPPVEQAPVEQPPVEQAPTEQAPVEQQPAVQPSTEQPAPEAVPPTDQPNALAAPVQPTTEPSSSLRSEEAPIETDANAPSNFILDQAEFIDTVVVSGAYIWLCCGVSLFLLVPLFLLFVYIRGRSKILQEENF